ncbi:MAG: aminoacyl-histidine dipeptidase [Lentisphaerae bacterium]|nr:aminoacyl-histidine dipeptidase [Lentisphaerota bacterium]
MSEISSLAPQNVWQIFDLICSIPHISGHETRLAEKLTALAREAGLSVLRDDTGNLIIEKPAAAGWENAPRIILQAHMDMVPASDRDFDFLNTPISPVIDGDYVRACGTTLGSDDGIGVALALSVILDREFHCGALTVILTVDEEVGLGGARGISPEHLKGRYLINLDGSDDGFCIGCAGGCRQSFTFRSTFSQTFSGIPVQITLSGLPGGHSGLCIHENRGNALKFMAEFVDQQPELQLFSFDGGKADNAIPDSAQVKGVYNGTVADLQKSADAFCLILKNELPPAVTPEIKVELTAAPQVIWDKTFRQNLLNALILVPNGALDFDDELQIVKTSSNLAAIETTPEKVIIKTSQRSLSDECRDNISAAVKTHFELFHAAGETGNVYPATTPATDSTLLKTAIACARELNRPDRAYAIHAGLESGWFSAKNPDLEIISCGPEHYDFHTPYEKLNIASVGKADHFLRTIICKLGR